MNAGADAHFIVKLDPAVAARSPYYDPSYGVDYLDAADFEAKAVKGSKATRTISAMAPALADSACAAGPWASRW